MQEVLLLVSLLFCFPLKDYASYLQLTRFPFLFCNFFIHYSMKFGFLPFLWFCFWIISIDNVAKSGKYHSKHSSLLIIDFIPYYWISSSLWTRIIHYMPSRFLFSLIIKWKWKTSVISHFHHNDNYFFWINFFVLSILTSKNNHALKVVSYSQIFI